MNQNFHQQLKLEEERLIAELREVEKEKEEAKKIFDQCEEEKQRLENEEERYWREYCSHKIQLTSFENESKRYSH